MKEIIIESGHGEIQYWRDLWRYRELLYYLAWRDILVRYKQTVIGMGWAVLRPVMTMFILTYVFGSLADMDSGNVPYSIMVFSGMLPWQFFSNSFSESANSIVANSGMITKVYFPRLVVPASSVITGIIDSAISSSILMFMMAYHQFFPGKNIIFLPIFLIMAFLMAFGSGIWISALMVRYRDLRFMVPFIVQFGLYISPVGYSSSKVNDANRLLYSFNPMVGVIDGVRWSIIGREDLYIPGLYVAAVIVILLNISGLWYFRRSEKVFADIV
jgi:lipopolysaccharide transport system permease protein